jgi:hypothetical protein
VLIKSLIQSAERAAEKTCISAVATCPGLALLIACSIFSLEEIFDNRNDFIE